jgi:hypothetical protein
MPRTAAGRPQPARGQLASHRACGHACQFGKDRPQQFRTLARLVPIPDAPGV